MNRKKKIAIVNVFFPPNSIGGATRVVADNFNALNSTYQNDFEITVFTTNPHHGEEYALDAYLYEGCRVYSLTTKQIPRLEWNHENLEIQGIFEEFLRFEKPDLIHFHCIQRLTASVLKAAKKVGVPYIVTAHDAWWISDFQFLVDAQGQVFLNGHEDGLSAPKPPAGVSESESLERRMKLKTLLQSAKKVLAVSQSFADIYKKNGFENCEVCKNGISSEVKWLPKNTEQSQKIVLGHFGGMSTHKGYDLLKASIIRMKTNVFELVVVDHSKGPDYRFLDNWGGCEVRFVGRQPQDKIGELYQSIDVLFAPSIWPESFGLVTREALASGCWVVASDIGGIGEDIDENLNGHRVKAGSADDLFRILELIASNPAKYKSMAQSKKLRSSRAQVEELVEYHYNV